MGFKKTWESLTKPYPDGLVEAIEVVCRHCPYSSACCDTCPVKFIAESNRFPITGKYLDEHDKMLTDYIVDKMRFQAKERM